MKLTRSAFVSIFVTMVLVAAVVLGMMYNSANNANKLARNNLNAERSSLTVLNKQKTDLNAQMAQAVADIAAWNNKIALLQTALGQAKLSLKQTQSKFPASAQTIEYNETLMGLAKSSNLTIHMVAATEPTKGDITTKEFVFYANVFTIEISGKVSDILNFVDKVATNGVFKTGAMTPVAFNIPQPLSQAEKDKMRADITVDLLAQVNDGLTTEKRLFFIEQAILELLEEPSQGPTVAQMTQKIKDIIAAEFGSNIADKLSVDIAQAIEKNVAGSLIGIVAKIYGDYIGKLIAEHTYDLIPQFFGKLGEDITKTLGDAIGSALPADITNIITKKLQDSVAKKIAALVSSSDVDAKLAAQVTAAEMPTAQLTVAVYSYKED